MNKKIFVIVILGIFLLSSFNAVGMNIDSEIKMKDNCINSLAVTEIEIETFNMWIEGAVLFAGANDCFISKINDNFVLTVPRNSILNVNFKSYWKIKDDQILWDEQWIFDDGLDCVVNKGDWPLLPDAGSGEMISSREYSINDIGKTGTIIGEVEHYTFEWCKSAAAINFKVEYENTDRIDKPSRPSGPTNGNVGVEYTYSTSATDPDGDNVCYGWDWNGDNTVDEWTGFYASGATVSASHTWTEEFTGNIKVKVKEKYGVESDWSDPLSITMPKSKSTATTNLFEKLTSLFPNLPTILKNFFNF